MINKVQRRTFLQSIVSVFAYAIPFGEACHKAPMHGRKPFDHKLSKEVVFHPLHLDWVSCFHPFEPEDKEEIAVVWPGIKSEEYR